MFIFNLNGYTFTKFKFQTSTWSAIRLNTPKRSTIPSIDTTIKVSIPSIYITYISSHIPSRLLPPHNPSNNKHHPRPPHLLHPLPHLPLPRHPPPNRLNGFLLPALRLPLRPPRPLSPRLRLLPHHEPFSAFPEGLARLRLRFKSRWVGADADAEFA